MVCRWNIEHAAPAVYESWFCFRRYLTDSVNAIIDKFFRDYRAKGYIFTQPKSVKMEKMYDGSTHGTLEFTVGIPKD